MELAVAFRARWVIGEHVIRTVVSHDAIEGTGLVDKVIENTVDVGRAFPEEARKIHYKEAPERHIRGSASTKTSGCLA